MAPHIAVTCGDPAGIGPEVVLKALAALSLKTEVRVFGPPALFERQAAELGVPCPPIVPVAEGDSWKPSEESGRIALAALDAALRDRPEAVVTAPVSKKWIAEGGVPFVGHTEYLAARAGVRDTTMMFVSERLKVSLATRHVPIREVPSRLSVKLIEKTIEQTADAMRRWFGVGSPRIAVAGLNPHAGEEGLLGREEKELIEPAVRAARERRIDCRGPYAGDSIFRRAMNGEFDAVVAMFHDQGLAAVKSVAPGAVNLTIGLPFVRTSPDHGTGFDIVGLGKADPEGMTSALILAESLILRRNPLV